MLHLVLTYDDVVPRPALREKRKHHDAKIRISGTGRGGFVGSFHLGDWNLCPVKKHRKVRFDLFYFN